MNATVDHDSGALASSDPVSFPLQSPYKSTFVTFLLQASHRLGTVSLLATIGTWGMMYAIKDFHVPLAIAAGTADEGMCCALAVALIIGRRDTRRREATGAAIFNGVLFVLALHLMLFARLDVIRSAISDFLTPTPPPVTAVN